MKKAPKKEPSVGELLETLAAKAEHKERRANGERITVATGQKGRLERPESDRSRHLAMRREARVGQNVLDDDSRLTSLSAAAAAVEPHRLKNGLRFLAEPGYAHADARHDAGGDPGRPS